MFGRKELTKDEEKRKTVNEKGGGTDKIRGKVISSRGHWENKTWTKANLTDKTYDSKSCAHET